MFLNSQNWYREHTIDFTSKEGSKLFGSERMASVCECILVGLGWVLFPWDTFILIISLFLLKLEHLDLCHLQPESYNIISSMFKYPEYLFHWPTIIGYLTGFRLCAWLKIQVFLLGRGVMETKLAWGQPWSRLWKRLGAAYRTSQAHFYALGNNVCWAGV